MRLRLILLLILALFTAPLASARAGWSCPDGTPCVASEKQGFECAGGQCRVQSCCESPHVRRCNHGVLPGLAGPDAGKSQFQSSEQCRFQQSDQPQLTAVHDASKLLLDAGPPVALPPAALQLPEGVTSHLRWLVDTCGYRPPPLLPAGPSRGPPCA